MKVGCDEVCGEHREGMGARRVENRVGERRGIEHGGDQMETFKRRDLISFLAVSLYIKCNVPLIIRHNSSHFAELTSPLYATNSSTPLRRHLANVTDVT